MFGKSRWQLRICSTLLLFVLHVSLVSADQAEPAPGQAVESPMIVRESGARMTYSIQGSGSNKETGQLFSINRDYSQFSAGTVLDRAAGLIWQQQDDNTMRTWEEAIGYCDALNLDGIDQWRLPERAELISLIDFSRVKPAIDDSVFPGTELFNYWAITEYTGTSEHAWTVLFAEGNVYCFRKILRSYTRCVSNVTSWMVH